jgi:tRNA A37 threonylcarbamoyltransferase TsaD
MKPPLPLSTAAPTTLADRIVAQRIASQDEAHRPYGGVVPEIAAVPMPM